MWFALINKTFGELMNTHFTGFTRALPMFFLDLCCCVFCFHLMEMCLNPSVSLSLSQSQTELSVLVQLISVESCEPWADNSFLHISISTVSVLSALLSFSKETIQQSDTICTTRFRKNRAIKVKWVLQQTREQFYVCMCVCVWSAW